MASESGEIEAFKGRVLLLPAIPPESDHDNGSRDLRPYRHGSAQARLLHPGFADDMSRVGCRGGMRNSLADSRKTLERSCMRLLVS